MEIQCDSWRWGPERGNVTVCGHGGGDGVWQLVLRSVAYGEMANVVDESRLKIKRRASSTLPSGRNLRSCFGEDKLLDLNLLKVLMKKVSS